MDDQLTTLLFEKGSCRAQMVRIDMAWQRIASQNPYPAAVQRMLGELVAASTLLSASLKFDGSLIIQIQGDGPVKLLVAECNSQLGVRATVKLLEDGPIGHDTDFISLVNKGGKGICAIILDPKNRQPGQTPYQGIVPLTGHSVAESLEAYMAGSEQLQTKLVLHADQDHAAGLMIQQMPNTGGVNNSSFDADAWDRLNAVIQTVGAEEHLQTATDVLARRLFAEENPLVLAQRPVQFECSCSRGKVARMLHNLGEEELKSALSESPTIEIQCDFCNAGYSFSQQDCEQLFATPDSTNEAGKPGTLH